MATIQAKSRSAIGDPEGAGSFGTGGPSLIKRSFEFVGCDIVNNIFHLLLSCKLIPDEGERPSVRNYGSHRRTLPRNNYGRPRDWVLAMLRWFMNGPFAGL
jgi:hypothetical protein